jgi:hypothetical protein
MYKKYSGWIIMILISSNVLAQNNKSEFHSYNFVGVSFGENEANGLIQTVNGIKYTKWFAGIGIGADYYFHRTIPLFIDVQKYLGTKENLFLYADGGYNFSLQNKPSDQEVSYYSTYKFTGGIYNDIGIGYKIRSNKKNSFVISTGYTYKKLHTKTATIYPCLAPPCPEEVSNYKLSYGRIVFKAGIELR